MFSIADSEDSTTIVEAERQWQDINDQLSENDLAAITAPLSSEKYIHLHENVINSDHPYAQVAIEFEIERISVLFGPKMLENILNTLGYDMQQGLTFLNDHVLIDQGHTKFNADLLERCIRSGGQLENLTTTGKNALNIYSQFLTECTVISTVLNTRNAWKTSDLSI